MMTYENNAAVASTTKLKWLSEGVEIFCGSIEQAALKIPSFERRPFVASSKNGLSSINRHRDVITRLCTNGYNSEIPVGLVSKKYGLVQHTAVFESAVSALTEASVDLEDVKARLILTEYGSRMSLQFLFPETFNFDPGDGNSVGLRLECFNSVDGSSRLWAVLGWLRFVCQNGMVLGTTRLNVKRVHNNRIEVGSLGESLRKALRHVPDEKHLLNKWKQTNIASERLITFVDGLLQRKWGTHAAARALLICSSGYDGIPSDPFQKARPSDLRMKEVRPVPGACAPARDAYSIAQSLMWLAKERSDVQDQLERVREIPSLIRALLKQKN
jgi:hypothetical protein